MRAASDINRLASPNKLSPTIPRTRRTTCARACRQSVLKSCAPNVDDYKGKSPFCSSEFSITGSHDADRLPIHADIPNGSKNFGITSPAGWIASRQDLISRCAALRRYFRMQSSAGLPRRRGNPMKGPRVTRSHALPASQVSLFLQHTNCCGRRFRKRRSQ